MLRLLSMCQNFHLFSFLSFLCPPFFYKYFTGSFILYYFPTLSYIWMQLLSRSMVFHDFDALILNLTTSKDLGNLVSYRDHITWHLIELFKSSNCSILVILTWVCLAYINSLFSPVLVWQRMLWFYCAIVIFDV